MLITFKSKAASEIMMYKEHARRILELLGKDVDRGIITHQQVPAAIATIEAAIAESRAHSVTQNVQFDVAVHPQFNEKGDHEHEKVESVSFGSRAYPLLEMLRAAQEAQSDVVWGV